MPRNREQASSKKELGIAGNYRTIVGREAVTWLRARRPGRRFLVLRSFRTNGEPNGHSDT